MKLDWTKGETADTAKNIKMEFKGSPLLRSKLTEICRKKQDSCRKSNILKSSYESPNWAFLQADSVGYQRALDEIIDFLKDDVEKQ